MIRWWDYVIALLAADFMVGNAMLALTGTEWWMKILGAVSAYFIWELWNDTYCPWRKRLEEKQ